MTTAPIPESPVENATLLESRKNRQQRLTAGALIILLGIGLFVLFFSARGSAGYALSDYFDEVQLPTITVPAPPVVLTCALLCLGAGVAFVLRRLPKPWPALIGTIAGIAIVLGFVTWAVAAGQGLPFTVSNQLAGTLKFATPLILGAMCGILCERAGIVNVAIEGQMLTGALAAVVVGSATQSVTLAILAACAASMVMGALLALFSIKYLVNHVVLGVVINLLASGLTGFLFDTVVRNDPSLNAAPISRIAIPVLSELPFVGPVLFNQPVVAYLAGAAAVIVWILLFRTKWGLRVRSVGEHPEAADTVGIRVHAHQWMAVLTGSFFAGIGGAFFCVAVSGGFEKDYTAGNGFIALAAVIMGRWHPGWATLMALFFGFTTQLGSQLQGLSTPVPSEFMNMLPYIVTVIAVAGLIGRVRAPAHDGEPYVKS